MRYTVFKFEQDADESSVTYVDGLGFISANNRIRYLRSLRRSSSFLCFLILLYFVCDQILIRPFTYLGYYLGLNIQINASTGWITMSESTSLLIGLFVHFVSLLLPLALCSLFYRDRLFSMRIFAPAQRGVSLIAIPITLAFGLLGEMIGAMIGDLSEIFGFLLRSQQNYHTMSDAAVWYSDSRDGADSPAALWRWFCGCMLRNPVGADDKQCYFSGFHVCIFSLRGIFRHSGRKSPPNSDRPNSARADFIRIFHLDDLVHGFFDKRYPDRNLPPDCGGLPRLHSLYPSGCKRFPAGASERPYHQ